MLTKLVIQNFKKFDRVEIELGNPVIFIGPNNSGKTTALQALSLWELGIRRWFERRGEEPPSAKERIGVAVNRKDVLASPVPSALLFWRNLHAQEGFKLDGARKTRKLRIDLLVEGFSAGRAWSAGLEFEYVNEESFLVRPLREPGHDTTLSKDAPRLEVPPEAQDVRVAFLPPMSGLSAQEFRKESGEVSVLIGEGRTAEVLRNLCHQVARSEPAKWSSIVRRIERLFHVTLEEPSYRPERGELTMEFREGRGPALDLSCSGRGLQQTLLLLSYLAANPRSVILLDEPDAHLEILRQRQVYEILSEAAREDESQVVAASHSEILLEEAADRDVVVAFVGRPHRIDDKRSQVRMALREIGFDQYYQAEQTGWVLYLEGATDLAILRAFAERLRHPATTFLERPFVNYIANHPPKARDHFFGLREAKPDLVGFLKVDRLESVLQVNEFLVERMWARREVENYLCQPETLMSFAEHFSDPEHGGTLFDRTDKDLQRTAMKSAIEAFILPEALKNRSDRWWTDTKASDDFLDRVFDRFFQDLGIPNLFTKTDYHRLVPFVPEAALDAEIKETLDEIAKVAGRAHPVE